MQLGDDNFSRVNFFALDVPESTTCELWPSVADHLAIGLADNWSQVCMAEVMGKSAHRAF